MAETKPTKVGQWATNANRTLEPALGEKQVGWEVVKKPPARFMNWLHNVAYQWHNWLNERMFDGVAAKDVTLQGTDETGTDVDGGDAILAGGDSTGAGSSFAALQAAIAGAAGVAVRAKESFLIANGATGFLDALKVFVGTAAGAGLRGRASGANNASVGVEGTGDVSGAATTSDGVKGTGAGTDGHGVVGAGAGTGPGAKGTGGTTGVGVEGVGGSSNGTGVKGTGTAGNAYGVEGTAHGTGQGVRGTGGSSGGYGTAGYGGGQSGVGVLGSGTNTGAAIHSVCGSESPDLDLGGRAGDHAAPNNGDLWYDSTANEIKVRLNNTTYKLDKTAI